MRNEQVDAAFRGILAGVSPQVPEEKVQMTATNTASQEVMAAAADALCDSNEERRALQMVYDLGRIDGSTEATLAALKRFTV